MLQYISADDVVVMLCRKNGQQIAGLKVGHDHAAVVRLSVDSLGFIEGQAIASALAGLEQELAQRAASAAQIEYGGLLLDELGEHRKGGALVRVNAALIDVQILDVFCHPMIMTNGHGLPLP